MTTLVTRNIKDGTVVPTVGSGGVCVCRKSDVHSQTDCFVLVCLEVEYSVLSGCNVFTFNLIYK
jgi:hypothetical protein